VIPKVITLRKSGPARGGFTEALQYVARDGLASRARGLDPIPVADMGLVNLDADLDTAEQRRWAAALMNATAARSVRLRKNPVYHLSLSWPEGEHPSGQQGAQAVDHVMTSLGMQDCEAFWALHRDTDHDHLHLIVNTIHPQLGKKVGPPRFDYAILHKACREIEILQGWSHDPGAWVVVEPKPGQIAILPRKVAQQLGLWTEADARRPAISRAAAAAEHRLGSDSFQTWVADRPATDLQHVLSRPGVQWADAHAVLARHGVSLQAKGSGMIACTRLDDGRVLTAKASQLGRWASKAELEKVLGPYQAPASNPKPQRSYQQQIHADRVRVETARVHGSVRNEDPQRAARREDRAQARLALAARFQAEQDRLKAERPRQRQVLRDQQQAQRAVLVAAHRVSRQRIRQQTRSSAMAPSVALSIWAFQAAREREALQQRQAEERKALTARLPRTEVWRSWLETQAGQGDEAAQSALRGIRYRQQRKRSHPQDGIAGEELGTLRQLTVAGLHAAIDHRRQQVIYRGQDGSAKFTDTGPLIVLHDKADATLEAALRIAAQKYGGQVEITGSSAFRERAARQAVRLGLAVSNPDLQAIVRDARRRVQGRMQERVQGRAHGQHQAGLDRPQQGKGTDAAKPVESVPLLPMVDLQPLGSRDEGRDLGR